jgi:hypothetical protein
MIVKHSDVFNHKFNFKNGIELTIWGNGSGPSL